MAGQLAPSEPTGITWVRLALAHQSCLCASRTLLRSRTTGSRIPRTMAFMPVEFMAELCYQASEGTAGLEVPVQARRQANIRANEHLYVALSLAWY